MITLIGHGVEEYGSSNTYFFLKDSKLSEGCMSDRKEMNRQCISTLDICQSMELYRRISQYPPTILVFDCCRSDFKPAIGYSLSSNASRGVPGASAEFENLCVIYSTNAGNTASDGPTGRNSPFMAQFHELIQVPGLELSALMKKLTANLAKSQLCKISSQLTEDFYFAKDPASSMGTLQMEGKRQNLQVNRSCLTS
jgi:hypothetical protein